MVCLSRPYPFKFLKATFLKIYLVHSLILCFPYIFNAVVTRTLLIVSFLFLSLYCSFQKKKGTTLQTRLYLNIVFVRAANSAS